MNLREILEAVRRVEIRTNRMVNDMMVGAYLSRFKGRGMDFEELRDYIPGDDVRDIDWSVTYRMGRPFVKRFREERELSVVIALDVSASSSFGSGTLTKREFAAEVAATMAFAAAHSSDKVGLLLFTDQVELFLPPRKGRQHIVRLIREALFFEPTHAGTRIPAALAFLNHVLKRRSMILLLTDFLHSMGAEAGARASGRDIIQEIGLTNIQHDLVCVHLHDPREHELPNAGLLALEDAETGELLEIDSARAAIRERYADQNALRLAELDRALRRGGVDTLRFSTNEPFAATLQRFFETRRRR
jgi:uncharacterized protein (DUF58 family)